MADQYGLFWNSVNGDRLYDADAFSEWLRKFFTNGVFANELQVNASSGMGVTVGTGYVNINGKVRLFNTATSLTLATAGSTYPRIDTIVVECNYTDRKITLKAVTGAYSGDTPTATAPVRTAMAYQLVLAEIYVAAGATSITQSNITDKRTDTSVCGIVASTITQMDFSQFTAQWADYIANFKKENEDSYTTWENNRKEIIQAFEDAAESSFNAWFASIKGQLEEDANARLTELTNEHEGRLSLLEHMVIKNDITCPIQLATSTTGNLVLLVDSDGKAIISATQYEER